ncbi:MAG: hypothetical protein H6573_27620 [Lewinellaceae bacterium]|nr:hypothetical protein [Lewinellaceae bacterium]
MKGNRGAAGIDGISLDEYERQLMAHIKRLREELLKGEYHSQAVRGVEIPKPNGGKRLLGIPTVEDRVVVKSQRLAERVMASLTRFIEEKLKLKVNREKSGVRRCDQVKFLGHIVEQNGKIRIADASIKRLKMKIREVTKRSRGLSFTQVIAETNRIIQGWAVYYRRCNTWLSNLRDMDGWIRSYKCRNYNV